MLYTTWNARFSARQWLPRINRLRAVTPLSRVAASRGCTGIENAREHSLAQRRGTHAKLTFADCVTAHSVLPQTPAKVFPPRKTGYRWRRIRMTRPNCKHNVLYFSQPECQSLLLLFAAVWSSHRLCVYLTNLWVYFSSLPETNHKNRNH